jgi:hypothetical protein
LRRAESRLFILLHYTDPGSKRAAHWHKKTRDYRPHRNHKEAQKSRREQGKKPKQHAQAVCHCATVSLKPTLCQQHHEPEPYNNRLELRRRQVRRVVRVVRLQLRKVPLKRNGVGLGGRQQNSVLKGLAYRIKTNKQKKKKNENHKNTIAANNKKTISESRGKNINALKTKQKK